MTVTIYHNPRCSKSRQTLALLEEKGIKPVIVEYLNDVPSKDVLNNLLDMLGGDVRSMMRLKEMEYRDNNLSDDKLDRSDLIAAMIKFPKLIERPIVVSGNKAVIGRPPENILKII